MIQKILMSLLCILILTSCGKESSSNPVDNGSNSNYNNASDAITPLAVGNTWNYVVYATMMKGMPRMAMGSITNRIVSKVNKNGIDWYVQETYTNNVRQVGIIPLQTNTKDGLIAVYDYSADYSRINDNQTFVTLQYPTKVGNTFSTYTQDLTTLSLNYPISVKAGDFKTIQYFYKSDSTDASAFASPGIGLIKSSTASLTAIGDTMWVDMELESYIIKK